MNARFVEISEVADYLGPGAFELPIYRDEIVSLVKRRGVFNQRIKQVPATGHPSRYFENAAISTQEEIAALDQALGSLSIEQRITVKAELMRVGLLKLSRVDPERNEHYLPLKALVAQINYNLFDLELGKQQSQFAYLQAKDLTDTVDGVLRTHDIALWNGTDKNSQYSGVVNQIAVGGNRVKVGSEASIVEGIRTAVISMVEKNQYPTAIYATPVLLDLLDREIKENRGIFYDALLAKTTGELPKKIIEGGTTVRTLATAAGDLPLIPEWTLPYLGTPGIGKSTLPAYIVTEDLIEYHWLGDPNPRVFQLSPLDSSAGKYAVVKFGAVVVKNAGLAHCQVLVNL